MGDQEGIVFEKGRVWTYPTDLALTRLHEFATRGWKKDGSYVLSASTFLEPHQARAAYRSANCGALTQYVVSPPSLRTRIFEKVKDFSAARESLYGLESLFVTGLADHARRGDAERYGTGMDTWKKFGSGRGRPHSASIYDFGRKGFMTLDGKGMQGLSGHAGMEFFLKFGYGVKGGRQGQLSDRDDDVRNGFRSLIITAGTEFLIVGGSMIGGGLGVTGKILRTDHPTDSDLMNAARSGTEAGGDAGRTVATAVMGSFADFVIGLVPPGNRGTEGPKPDATKPDSGSADKEPPPQTTETDSEIPPTGTDPMPDPNSDGPTGPQAMEALTLGGTMFESDYFLTAASGDSQVVPAGGGLGMFFSIPYFNRDPSPEGTDVNLGYLAADPNLLASVPQNWVRDPDPQGNNFSGGTELADRPVTVDPMDPLGSVSRSRLASTIANAVQKAILDLK